MSIALYESRLYWDGGHGGAALHWRHRQLDRVPMLPGLEHLRIDAIDWAPAMISQIREQHHGWRDMTPAEIGAVREFLRRLFMH
jgi:hypothetical protein